MSHLLDRLRELQDHLQNRPFSVHEIYHSELVRFYTLLAFFFAMVFILPMTPLILFTYLDTEPSINPKVFEFLYNVAAREKNE